MNDAVGVAAIVGGSVLGVLTVLAFWRRGPAAIVVALAAVAGMLVGAGALAVQDAPAPADWVVTLVVLGGLTPVHASVLRGRPGRAS